jgi:hypothetical protein
MLHWLHRRTRHTAATLVVSLVALGIPHSDDPNHDADCVIGAFVMHDASAHRLTAKDSDGSNHSNHCLACHAARSFRPRAQLRYAAAPVSTRTIVVHLTIVTASSAGPHKRPPLRAPPASPRTV